MRLPGSRLGRYEIRTLLGAGGMGEVYLAHDAQLQRPVALKVLGAAVRNDEDLRRRLEFEARAASALNHPNILTVYDIGQEGEERFIAMEYVDGITLRQRLMQEQPTLREILDLGVQIASALAAAEGAGLVHRDIKPDNIMVRPDGYVKLLDFGLARTAQPESSTPEHRKTDPFTVRGTVFYMSPEQLRGFALDSRSDIWSTGVVLYELLSGRLPFEGDSATDTAASILRADPPRLTNYDRTPAPPRFTQIVAKAMHKDRAQRYQSAQQMLEDLQTLRLDLERNAERILGSQESRMATTEQVPVFELPQTNLPQKLTPFVGRDAEREDVLALLRRDEVRLVTLTGPGGTGKTRLALEVSNTMLRVMDDGVWWVSLAPIVDPRLLLSEIASVLGLAEGSMSLQDTVRAAFRERSMLVVLDNFEQVLDAATQLSEILSGTRAKVLVTSRSPLRIGGEREYAVPPLSTPPLDLPLDEQALSHYASVALFVDRATAVKSDFVLSPDNARAIAELCVRLDGLPLAIELAAARVKVLPPRAMLARVENRFGFLSGGSRDLPERQQTMRATISWGYQLLTEAEQHLFASLAVFRGGFTMEQAERLVGDDTVLDGISSLLDKAFLRRDPGASEEEPRFTMLETIRDYGLEVLHERAQVHAARNAHAQLMTALAEENELDTERLKRDEDNYRIAIDWAVSSNDAELALRLGAALWWSWYVTGHYTEGRRALDRILAVPGGEDVPVRAKAQTGAGAMAFLQCDYAHAIDLLESSIVLSKRHGDPMSLARSLQFRGSIARERAEYEHAIDLHLLSRALWEELEDPANVGRSLNYVGFCSWLNCEFARTVEMAEQTLQMFKDRQDTDGVVWSLLNLAAATLYSGNPRGAEQRLDECLSWSRAGGFQEGIAWSLNLLGVALRERADPRAEMFLQDSLRIQWHLGDRWRCASLLEALGGVRRDPCLLGAAAVLRRQLGTPVPPAERPQHDADVASIGIEECNVAAAVERAIG